MAKEISWNDASEEVENSGSKFYKWKRPTNKLRFCTRPMAYSHSFKEGEKPKRRYSCVVIDLMTQNAQPQIIDFGKSVYSSLKAIFEINGIEPHADNAPGFAIQIQGQGLETKYQVLTLNGPCLIPEDLKGRVAVLQTELANRS